MTGETYKEKQIMFSFCNYDCVARDEMPLRDAFCVKRERVGERHPAVDHPCNTSQVTHVEDNAETTTKRDETHVLVVPKRTRGERLILAFFPEKNYVEVYTKLPKLKYITYLSYLFSDQTLYILNGSVCYFHLGTPKETCIFGIPEDISVMATDNQHQLIIFGFETDDGVCLGQMMPDGRNRTDIHCERPRRGPLKLRALVLDPKRTLIVFATQKLIYSVRYSGLGCKELAHTPFIMCMEYDSKRDRLYYTNGHSLEILALSPLKSMGKVHFNKMPCSVIVFKDSLMVTLVGSRNILIANISNPSHRKELKVPGVRLSYLLCAAG